MKILRFLFTILFMIYSHYSIAHEINSFAPIVKKTLPAVVSIRTKIAGVSNAKLFENMEIPKEMEEMLEDFFKEKRKGNRPDVQQGSGFIFDKKGYVLTNYHVIHRGTTVEVILQDGTIYQTEVKGIDPLTDLAVLKIKNFKKPLPIIKFADSNKSQVGDWVIAIGNPLGLGGTVTKGIVSARGRNIRSGLYDDYIQTDTPINRGNSGGPLINMDGNVIGVNTVIFSPTGGSIGLGFAISSNLAKNVADQLVAKGSVSRAWLGVSMRSVTGEMADSLGMKQIQGVIIRSVQKGSPADKGGIKVGDVIFAIGGKMITKKNRLPVLIAKSPINKPVTFEIYRKGKIKKLKIKLVKRDEKTHLSIHQWKMKLSKPNNYHELVCWWHS